MASTVASLDRTGKQMIEVQGRPAAFTTAGEGLPVLFLHGWGLGFGSYARAHAQLVAQGTRVTAPALPGFGRTAPLPVDDVSFDGYADWIADFCREVGIEQAIVVGHSFGGGVATAAVHRHPHLARALVLVNAVGGSTWKLDADAGPRALLDRPWWDWGVHFPREILPLRHAVRVLPTVLRDAIPNLVRRPRSLWRVGELARTADLTTELEDLKRRRLPVVALWGARDRVVPEAAFRDVCAALGSEGQIVDGNHAWLLADPVGFGEVVTNVVEVARSAHDLEQAGWPPGLRWLGRRLQARADRAACDT